MSLAEEEIAGDMETDFDILPIEDEVKTVDQERKPGVHWGEMSKYSDEDFRGVRRLNVPERVDFVQRSTHIEGNPVGKYIIENTSSLPMTYMISSLDQTFHTKRISPSPDMGWIAPRSVAILEIRLTEKDSKTSAAPSFETRVKRRAFDLGIIERGKPYFGYFVIFAAPIFREEHVEETKLELFWKGFGTDSFPISHAEVHESMVGVTLLRLGDDYKLRIRCPNGGYDPAPLKWTKDWEKAPGEEFNSLWAAGTDPDEYKFCLEFRLKESQHVAKLPDSLQEKRSLCETILSFPLWLIFGLLLLLIIFVDLSNHSCSYKGPESNSSETESTFSTLNQTLPNY